MREQHHEPDDDNPEASGPDELNLAEWPGTDVAGVCPVRLLDHLRSLNADAVDAQVSVGAAAACEHLLRHLSALQLRFLARAAGVGGPEEDPDVAFDELTGVDMTAAEIAPLLGLSPRSAQNKVARALGLVRDLPKLVALVRSGAIDLQRATAVDDVMREVLDPRDEVWNEVHDAIAEQAPGRTMRRLRELTRRAVNNADPEAASRRHEAATARRRVALDPLPDAMAAVTAILPADQGQLVDTVLDALADGCRAHLRAAGTPDPRTHEQRRADAFVALFRSVAYGTPLKVVATGDSTEPPLFGGRFERATSDAGVVAWWLPPNLPRQQGRRPQITVTMPLSTLTGDDEQAADLAGYGPVPAPLARAIAAEAGRYRVVPLPGPARRGAAGASAARGVGRSPVAPGGTAVRSSPGRGGGPALGPPRPVFHGPGDQAECTTGDPGYRPAQSLIDRVAAFHQVCRHPGCVRAARRCDVDHVVRYPEGRTCACNLMPLCRRHHRLKTHGGWAARFTTPEEGRPAGTVEWISPLGRRYYDEPTIYDHGWSG